MRRRGQRRQAEQIRPLVEASPCAGSIADEAQASIGTLSGITIAFWNGQKAAWGVCVLVQR
jgi:hypothetical protein